MDYSKYWEFFSTKTFKTALNVGFFQNGYFAIFYADKFEVYDNECNLCKTYEHRNIRNRYDVLSNGMIVECKNNEICVIAKDGIELKKPYTIKNIQDIPKFSGNLVLVRSMNGHLRVYSIYRDKEPEILQDFGENVEALSFVSSFNDSKIYTINLSTLGRRIFKNKTDVTNSFLPVGLDKLLGVEVMKNGCFITRYGTHCSFFGENLNKLATANGTFGIITKGDYCVGFEDKLLLNSEGDIVCEETPNLVEVACDGTLLLSHKAINKYGTGYFLNARQMSSYQSNYRCNTKMTIIYSQEMIFPLSFELKKEDVTGVGIYYKRLREMLTH
ncbi:MAG: hypothetical protein IKW39_05510 [Alphaproteobacteria bacterium]|nr:hypothetical protein [Alphaproteobacteria bacterium]